MELSTGRPLPPLREELNLHAAAPAIDGSPRWVIEDPVTQRFHELDRYSFEVLRHWALRQPEQIATHVNANTTLNVTTDDVSAVHEYLAQAQLLQSEGGQPLYQQWKQRRRSALSRLLHSYLFFRIPLLHPDRTLDRVAPLFHACYRPAFWYAMLFIACLGIFLVIRQWDAFIGTFALYGQWQDWVWFGMALATTKCVHELGHALSARRYGCRVPSMGIAFLVLWPVLYTDTNEVWKLTSRRARLVVAASGMAAELALAACATLAWSLTPEGPLRSALFFLASTSWLITLGINLNPFMRFDGYFLLADWLRQPNLHGRAFAMGRWWLRKQLLGLADPPPEVVSRASGSFMIGFAFGTWLYRLILFIGIALMVYHLFFKLLGIALMIVELAWFIGKPVKQELLVWWQRRSDIGYNPRALGFGAFILLMLTSLFWPWSHSLRVPAVVLPADQQSLYASSAARVTAIHIDRGDSVQPGQPLINLESPDLAFERAQILHEIGQLRWQLDHQTSSAQLLREGDLIRERLVRARNELQRINTKLDKLRVTAPIAGTVTDLNLDLKQGQWVMAEEHLATVSQPGTIKAQALIPESDLGYLALNQPALLIPDQPEQSRFECAAVEADPLALNALPSAHLASIHGGPIAVNTAADGQLVPDQATYRLNLTQCSFEGTLAAETLATAHLSGTPYSAWQSLWRRIQGVLIRESGF